MHVEDPWSRWAGVALPERGRQRRQLILDAAFELVRQGGLDEVTIRAVSRLSGVHRRYFSESFDSREALLRAMFDTARANVAAAGLKMMKRNPAASTDEQLRTVIQTSLSFFTQNPAQAQVLFAAIDEPSLRERWDGAMASFRLLISSSKAIEAPTSMRDAVVVALLEGAVVEFGKRWMARELGDDAEIVADVSAEAILELMRLNQSIAGANERAAALWRSVTSQ